MSTGPAWLSDQQARALAGRVLEGRRLAPRGRLTEIEAHAIDLAGWVLERLGPEAGQAPWPPPVPEYSSLADAAEQIRLALESGPHPGNRVGPEWPAERDWASHAYGYGVAPGDPERRWLVTCAGPVGFTAPYPRSLFRDDTAPETTRGWLVALETDRGGRTGRCLQLAGPWSPAHDQAMLDEAHRQPWWPRSAGPLDLELLALWVHRR